ncbi:hypothetical protein [Gordonia sihwensis]|uniref:hypothetical protein n=1 Tax=Gordonia sihwensis TaxID=173559 RepID=UPI003D971916
MSDSDSIEVNPPAAAAAIGVLDNGNRAHNAAYTRIANAIKMLDGTASGDAKNASVDINQMLQNSAARFEETITSMKTTAQQQVEQHISIDRSRGGAVRGV